MVTIEEGGLSFLMQVVVEEEKTARMGGPGLVLFDRVGVAGQRCGRDRGVMFLPEKGFHTSVPAPDIHALVIHSVV